MNLKQFIPVDKSWIIRMGFLDATRGDKYENTTIHDFIEDNRSELGDDLISLEECLVGWKENRDVTLESATAYRLLQFEVWKHQKPITITKSKTLIGRPMCENPDIVNWCQEDLLQLDKFSSQWATAAVIYGDKERLKTYFRGKEEIEIPFKLKVSYDAVEHWEKQKEAGEPWSPRVDPTLEAQAKAWIDLMAGKKTNYKDEQAEDFFFSAIMGFKKPETLFQRYPSIVGHETPRLEEYEKIRKQLSKNETVETKDRRGMQAAVMYKTLHGMPITEDWNVVSKSWKPELFKAMIEQYTS